VENAQRTYDTALSRWLTNKIESRANLTNIAVLTPAVEPLEPRAARRLIGAMSVLVGLLLGRRGGVPARDPRPARALARRPGVAPRRPSLGRLSRWQPLGAACAGAGLLRRAFRARLPHPL